MSDSEEDYDYSSDEEVDNENIDTEEWNRLVEYQNQLEERIVELETSKDISDEDRAAAIREAKQLKADAKKQQNAIKQLKKDNQIKEYEMHRIYENLRQDLIKLRVNFLQLGNTIKSLHDEGNEIPQDIIDSGDKIFGYFGEIGDIYAKKISVYKKYEQLLQKERQIRGEYAILKTGYDNYVYDLQTNSRPGGTRVLDQLEPLDEDLKVITGDLSRLDHDEMVKVVEETEASEEQKKGLDDFFEKAVIFFNSSNKLLAPMARTAKNLNQTIVNGVAILAFFGIVTGLTMRKK